MLSAAVLLGVMFLFTFAVACLVFGMWSEQEVVIKDAYHQRNRANQRRKRIEKSLRHERAKNKLVNHKMVVRHGQVLAELEKAHAELDELEQRYRVLAAQVVDGMLPHEEKQILSLFQPPKEKS